MPAHPLDITPPPDLPNPGSGPVPPRGAEPESEIIGPVADRYDLGEQIARGGMGIVYRAHDRHLNRTVAIKIIRTRFLRRPDLLRRFIAEARISGRLQHPGVVPVYEVGTLPDARPFIVMKLIEGRTLARLLRERTAPGENLPHFLKVFEALCHTVAYAHQQGVIHRDLKPDNIMVGEFGEVQVMDWGLAKFLDPAAALALAPDGFEAVERSAYLSGDGTTPAGENQTLVTVVQAVGPDTPGAGYTTVGAILGTLPYMPPEQARGEADRVDRRGDVFSLGAILCQILTGQPPYFGPPETLRDQAREGKLFGAYVLLDRCGTDPALIALAKQCLVANPDARPADAAVLAALVTECLDGLQNQTRAIEVKRATAEARLAEAEARERLVKKARRLSGMLAVVGVLVAGLLAAGLGWYEKERATREANEARRRAVAVQQIEEALAEAETLDEQAGHGAGSALVQDAAAKQALSACQRAEALIETTPNTPAEVGERFAGLKSRLTETERGTRLTVALEDWRANLFDARGDLNPSAHRIWQILDAHGIKVLERDFYTVVAELRSHPASASLRGALTDWLALEDERSNKSQLYSLLRAAWGDPGSKALGLREPSVIGRVDFFTPMGPDPTVPASWLIVGANWLKGEGQGGVAEQLLVHGVRRFPADFTLNAMYGSLLRQKPGSEADAVRYLTVARTARPGDETVERELGLALADAKRADEALDTLRAAIKADPKWLAGHIRIGELLEKRGEVDAARASFLVATSLDAKSGLAQFGLARTELARGDLAAAEVAFRAATEDAELKGPAHAGLGRVYLKRWEASKAVDAFRLAVAADPANVDYRLGLVEAVSISNDYPGTLREAREAARVIPKSAALHKTVGDSARAAGDQKGAVAAYQAAAKCDPADVDLHVRLAETYEALDDRARAADVYQAVANLRPKDTKVLLTLAGLRQKAGEHAAAREAYGRAVEIEPTDLSLRQQFGRYLASRWDERAVEEFAAAVKVKPESAELRVELGESLLKFGRFREAAATLRAVAEQMPADSPRREAIKSQARTATKLGGLSEKLADVWNGTITPGTPAAWADFAEAARRTRQYAAAARCFAAAAEGDPRYVGPAAVCAALAGFGRGADADRLSPDARAELRRMALESFRQLRGPLADPLLDPLKDRLPTSGLPAEERAAWRALWAGE